MIPTTATAAAPPPTPPPMAVALVPLDDCPVDVVFFGTSVVLSDVPWLTLPGSVLEDGSPSLMVTVVWEVEIFVMDDIW